MGTGSRGHTGMVPQNVSDPCPWPQAQQGTLFHSPLPRDGSRLWRGFWDRRELLLLPQELRGKRDTAGESFHISPSFKHFFSKLKQSISEAFTASLETGQSKISHLICLYIPIELLSLCKICQQNLPAYSFPFVPHYSFSFSLQTNTFHQKFGSFLSKGTCTSSQYLLIASLQG